MSRRIMKGIIAGILILIANVGLFLFSATFTATFWICYFFTMLAAIIATYVEIVHVENKPVMYVYEVSAVTGLYLVVQLIAGSLCRNFLFLFPIRAFFIQFCILAAYLIMLLFVSIHGSHVSEQQQVRGRAQVNFRYILEAMKSAMAKMEYSNPQKKMVQHAYDSLASGQVMSGEVVYDIEQQMIATIDELGKAITAKDDVKVSELCNTLENLADQRKTKLNVKNPF